VKIHCDIEQGGEEWLRIRAGKATASEFGSVLAKGEGKTRAKYLRQLIAERLTGVPSETYRNAHMDRGTEQEPLARWAYELETGFQLQRVAFIEHDSLLAGCSPDSLVVGKKRGVEIKCVIPTVQVETILRGTLPPEHKPQVQGGMWIAEYEEWDFVSYSPLMPKHLRTYIHTVKRDETYIKGLEVEVRTLLNEVESALKRLSAGQQDIGALLQQSIKEPACSPA
jgi:hypothetical protein